MNAINDPVARLPFERDAEAVLADWSAVERDLQVATVSSPEAARLHVEVERLRDEYEGLKAEARRTYIALRDFPLAAPPLS
jgi:hypothetical protein